MQAILVSRRASRLHTGPAPVRDARTAPVPRQSPRPGRAGNPGRAVPLKIPGFQPAWRAYQHQSTPSMSSSAPSTPISYKDAGVDIDAGDALVERIKPLAKKTMREGVMAGIGQVQAAGL